MNKQEVIETLKSEARYHCGEKECYKDGCTKNVELDIAIDIVNQIDEPEKSIVPQYVADWYEDNKNDFEWEIYQLCVKYHEYELEGEIKNWFDSMDNKPIQTLVNMHQFGYEVEKEKLYTVELPNPNRTDVSLVLGLYNDGKAAIFAVCTESWKYEKRYKLTEAEIKKDFEWAWQFAEEVE